MEQCVKFDRRINRSDLPEELAEFVDEDGTFNTTRYFQTFVNEMHRVIKEKSVELPDGLILSTNFTRCEICRNDEEITPQYMRCRHQPNCEEHKKTRKNPHYKEECDCKVYNLPSLTFSKIGIVIHFLHPEKEEPFIMDVDINPPTIPSILNVQGIPGEIGFYAGFNGSNKMKRLWLKKNRHRVRNWRAEWRKTHDMSAAGRVYQKERDSLGNKILAGNRSVRFRFVNRNLVIPEQVTIFKISMIT